MSFNTSFKNRFQRDWLDMDEQNDEAMVVLISLIGTVYTAKVRNQGKLLTIKMLKTHEIQSKVTV